VAVWGVRGRIDNSPFQVHVMRPVRNTRCNTGQRLV